MLAARRPSRQGPRALWALVLALWIAAAPSPPPATSQDQDVPRLLRLIRDEILGLDRYPGEDFHRGEFHLGPGDDDTNKTHAVGILVRGAAEDFLMTVQVSRLDRSSGDPRVFYARPPQSVICAFPGREVRLVRSDYPPSELEDLLTAVLRAVIDKKNLLKRRVGPRSGSPTSP